MAEKEIWVSPHGDGQWQVKHAGVERAMHVVPTQEEAVRLGQEEAARERIELIVQSHTGEIEWRSSFGHDPYPPEG